MQKRAFISTFSQSLPLSPSPLIILRPIFSSFFHHPSRLVALNDYPAAHLNLNYSNYILPYNFELVEKFKLLHGLVQKHSSTLFPPPRAPLLLLSLRNGWNGVGEVSDEVLRPFLSVSWSPRAEVTRLLSGFLKLINESGQFIIYLNCRSRLFCREQKYEVIRSLTYRKTKLEKNLAG